MKILISNNSQHPRNEQDRGGELKPCVACDKLDNGSPADTYFHKKQNKLLHFQWVNEEVRLNPIMFNLRGRLVSREKLK